MKSGKEKKLVLIGIRRKGDRNFKLHSLKPNAGAIHTHLNREQAITPNLGRA